MKVYRRHDRGNDWWIYFRYDCPDTGKRKSFRRRSPIQTRAAAEKWGREQLSVYGDPRALREHMREVPTLAEFRAEWVAWHSTKVKASTIATYEHRLDKHLIPAFGARRLDEIRPRDVASWISTNDHLSVRTRSGVITLLRQMIAQAKRWELVDDVPDFEIPTPPPPQAWTFLEADEAARLLKVCARDRYLFSWAPVALYTGLRTGELCGLKWGDVDLERRKLRVVRQFSKGRVSTPKSGKSRTVPLPQAALRALTEQRAETYMRGDWVWCDDDGAPITSDMIKSRFRIACRNAGVREVRVHDLRHTYASMLVRRGVGLKVVQELLGHHSVTVTQRYAHLAPDDLSAAVEVLDFAPALHRAGVDPGKGA